MKAHLLPLLLGLALCLPAARAVENGSNSTFNTTAPTSGNIANWNTGWTQPVGQTGVTGWNYVGTVAAGGGTASGVYLGNGWVLTAAHVGAATFALGSSRYTVVSGTIHQGLPWVYRNPQTGQTTDYTADITLFQIQPDGVTTFALPNLPSLTIATGGPSVGDSVAMIGYGDGGSITNKTWGLNTVTANNELVGVDSFVSNDFETAYGVDSNEYYLVLGDSGGGDFVYNSGAGQWQLVGINEATNQPNPPTPPDSYFVQLSTYASQINAIVASNPVPAMPHWGWVVLPVMIVLLVAGYLPKSRAG